MLVAYTFPRNKEGTHMLDFTDTASNSPFPQNSELYFRVATRKLHWHNERTGEHIHIDKQKAIVREAAGGGQWLATVGENYELVENRDLFPYVEKFFEQRIDRQYLRNVDVIEHQSYNGRDCYREYRFKDLKCNVPQGDVAYRAIVGNSYGGKSVTLLSGAIDFFCTNGMIIGQSEKQARKHTSGFELSGVTTWINNSLSQFAAQGKRIRRLADVEITLTEDDGLLKHLVDKGLLSARRAVQVIDDTEQERRDRGGSKPTLWHMYSALTAWASHSDVRDTGNDHTANTRIQRTQHAERVIRAADAYVSA